MCKFWDSDRWKLYLKKKKKDKLAVNFFLVLFPPDFSFPDSIYSDSNVLPVAGTSTVSLNPDEKGHAMKLQQQQSLIILGCSLNQ